MFHLTLKTKKKFISKTKELNFEFNFFLKSFLFFVFITNQIQSQKKYQIRKKRQSQTSSLYALKSYLKFLFY
jgi:hypothetical protein